MFLFFLTSKVGIRTSKEEETWTFVSGKTNDVRLPSTIIIGDDIHRRLIFYYYYNSYSNLTAAAKSSHPVYKHCRTHTRTRLSGEEVVWVSSSLPRRSSSEHDVPPPNDRLQGARAPHRFTHEHTHTHTRVQVYLHPGGTAGHRVHLCLPTGTGFRPTANRSRTHSRGPVILVV